MKYSYEFGQPYGGYQRERGGSRGQMYGEGRRFDREWRHAMPCTENVSQTCTLEPCMIVLTSVPPIHLIVLNNKI